jgi:hypothetical protein
MSIANISSSTTYVAPAPLTQGTQSTSQISGSIDSDGDSDGSGGGGGRAHRTHGGGQMQNALMQALQSLGLSMPQNSVSGASSGSGTTAAAGTSATTTPSTAIGAIDSDGDSDGSSSSTGNVKKDFGNFMHALFQAVKSENASSSSSTTGSSASDPKANFAAGLTALISQVGSGSAPSSLQSAFDQLTADLQPASSTASTGGGSSTGSTGSTSGTGSSAQATLQALLTQLQQNLGYGASSGAAAIGNLLTAQA